MLEMMMGRVPSNTVSPLTKPNFGFNFDKLVSTGNTALTVANSDSKQAAVPVSINGYTKALNATASNAFGMTPVTIFNYYTGDFTVELVFLIASAANGYTTLFAQNNGSNIGVVIRLGDNGYGNRLQVSTAPGAASTVYSTPITRANLVNKWTHIAMQRKDNMISVYVNGVLQGLAVGTGTTYDATARASAQSLNLSSSGQLALMAAGAAWIAELAVYDTARHNANFTPAYPIYQGA